MLEILMAVEVAEIADAADFLEAVEAAKGAYGADEAAKTQECLASDKEQMFEMQIRFSGIVDLNEKFDFKLQFRSRQVLTQIGYKHFSPNTGLEVGGGYVSLGEGFRTGSIVLETYSMQAILQRGFNNRAGFNTAPGPIFVKSIQKFDMKQNQYKFCLPGFSRTSLTAGMILQ